MNNKLFVWNLSFDCTELTLQELFAAQGVVQEVHIVTDRVIGRPRGFAFVTMSRPEEARAAITALNGTPIAGRNITVTEARPREERPPAAGAAASAETGAVAGRGPRRDRF